MSRAAFAAVLAAVALGGCKKPPGNPVCGLHSAAGPVVLEGKKDRTLAVGATVRPGDQLEVKGDALLECFGGALVLLEKGDEVTVGELDGVHVEGDTLPRLLLRDGKPSKRTALPPSVRPRYSDSLFTPESALSSGQTTTGEYLKAFFTPNGIENLQGPARPDGPSKLPPPPNRPRVPHIHAGPLGEGGPTLKVEDDTVFVETDDLATAALVEGKTYELGRAVRLVLPDGAEATLEQGGASIELEGPMDLHL